MKLPIVQQHLEMVQFLWDVIFVLKLQEIKMHHHLQEMFVIALFVALRNTLRVSTHEKTMVKDIMENEEIPCHQNSHL